MFYNSGSSTEVPLIPPTSVRTEKHDGHLSTFRRALSALDLDRIKGGCSWTNNNHPAFSASPRIQFWSWSNCDALVPFCFDALKGPESRDARRVNIYVEAHCVRLRVLFIVAGTLQSPCMLTCGDGLNSGP